MVSPCGQGGSGPAGEKVSGSGSHTFRCLRIRLMISALSMSAMMRMVAPQLAVERIDLVDLLDQAGPVSFAPGVNGGLVDDDGCRSVMRLFGHSSDSTRAVGVVAVVTHQMFVPIRDVVQELTASHFRAGMSW